MMQQRALRINGDVISCARNSIDYIANCGDGKRPSVLDREQSPVCLKTYDAIKP